jgi:hypothetical protein
VIATILCDELLIFCPMEAKKEKEKHMLQLLIQKRIRTWEMCTIKCVNLAMCQIRCSLAASTLIILFVELFKFFETYFFQRTKFCEVKWRIFLESSKS